ncbi:MAG: ATP-dependent sacrificial sulfur transferase LarE [Lachnospiraceae bacterium]
MEQGLREKYDTLVKYLEKLHKVAVAFSNGVDSTFLLKTAHDVLGDNAIAITVKSCSFPNREYRESIDFCEREHIRHVILERNELDIEGFSKNPPNRCYICKKELFKGMKKLAKEQGAYVLVEGSNMDDRGDYRPGMAAIKELEVKSPLCYASMTKADIRELSKELGLYTWDKPSFACLSTRFPYGEIITEEKLKMVELGEEALFEKGFSQARVRIHGDTARIEILPEDFYRIMEPDIRVSIVAKLKQIGFLYVCLDMQGYRMGSMNEGLGKQVY